MNVSWNRKVKKLAHLPGCWLDLPQIWCKVVFLDSKSKINNKILYDVILTSKWREGKIPIIVCRKRILRHYDVTFCPIFLKTSIYLFLMKDYHHIKFGLIWIKESKVTGRIPPPQVENVLNCPGEIGLKLSLVRELGFPRFLAVIKRTLKLIFNSIWHGGGRGKMTSQNVFDHCAETPWSRKLKLCDF